MQREEAVDIETVVGIVGCVVILLVAKNLNLVVGWLFSKSRKQ